MTCVGVAARFSMLFQLAEGHRNVWKRWRHHILNLVQQPLCFVVNSQPYTSSALGRFFLRHAGRIDSKPLLGELALSVSRCISLLFLTRSSLDTVGKYDAFRCRSMFLAYHTRRATHLHTALGTHDWEQSLFSACFSTRRMHHPWCMPYFT